MVAKIIYYHSELNTLSTIIHETINARIWLLIEK